MKTQQRLWLISTSLFLALGGADAVAETPNFKYSSLSLAANVVSYDDDVVVRRGGGTGEVVRFSGVAGASVGGILQFSDNLIVSVAGSALSDEGYGVEIEESSGSLGLGYVTPIGTRTDLLFALEFVDAEVQICNLTRCSTVEDSGYGATAGMRRWVSESIEINANVSYADLGDLGDTTSVGAGGAYWLDGHSSITTSLSRSSDATGLSLGYRYAF